MSRLTQMHRLKPTALPKMHTDSSTEHATEKDNPMLTPSADGTAALPGHRMDAKGRLVPEHLIRPIDLERDRFVREVVAKAKEKSDLLREFKRDVFADIAAFLQLSAEQYGAKLGGNKGNVTLYTFDGRYKVLRAMSDRIVFDERLQAAKALIDECLVEWSEGAHSNLVALVKDAFRADSAGEIRTGSVLQLRRLDITDDRWCRAMRAIGDAVQVVDTKSYVRVYERDDNGEYRPINLDIAGV
jgi:Protein of unknown function (DUF3164)